MAEHASLLREMDRALLAEFGARAIYARLSRRVRDPKLAEILAGFAREEDEQIERLRETMRALGVRPRAGSLRRRALADALAWTSRVIGPRLALRICEDAEQTRGRWYAHFQEYLARAGLSDLADACARMSVTKQRHAQVLGAWVNAASRR